MTMSQQGGYLWTSCPKSYPTRWISLSKTQWGRRNCYYGLTVWQCLTAPNPSLSETGGKRPESHNEPTRDTQHSHKQPKLPFPAQCSHKNPNVRALTRPTSPTATKDGVENAKKWAPRNGIFSLSTQNDQTQSTILKTILWDLHNYIKHFQNDLVFLEKLAPKQGLISAVFFGVF